MANLFTLLYFLTTVHSLIVWELDLSEYCDPLASWNCSSNVVFKSNEVACGNNDCFRIKNQASVEINNINTSNQYDLYLNYTLVTTGLTDTEFVYIFVITDTETITLSHKGLHSLNTYSILLNASASNQASIAIKFKIDANVNTDQANFLNVILYNYHSYAPTNEPTFIPTVIPTLEPTIFGDNNDNDKIAFGTEYKDRYMLILAGSMFTGAVLIIVYFRCCKKRRDEKRALAKRMENEQQLEMQEALNKNSDSVNDEIVKNDDENTNNNVNTKGKNDEKHSKKDKVKDKDKVKGNGKTKIADDSNYDINIGSASPTSADSVISVDVAGDD